MENLEQYLKRTEEFMFDSFPEIGNFKTNPGLKKKVAEDGKFRSFAGDTITFLLDEAVKNKAAQMQDILYENCADILAEPVERSAFHITLHDLSNGEPSDALWRRSEWNRMRVKEIFHDMIGERSVPIYVKSVNVFNLANTSIVIGLKPANEKSCFRLMELYDRFQSVVYLDYPLTLHITLGYYKPGIFSSEQCLRLSQTMKQLYSLDIGEIVLNENELIYQRFDDMNHYEKII